MKRQGKIPFLIMIAGIVLCGAARAFAIFSTDMNLGSIKHGNEILCNALYFGVLVLCAAGAVITAKRESICEYTGFTDAKSNIIGFATLILALGVGYEGVLELNALTPSVFFAVLDYIFAVMLVIVAFVTLWKKAITAGIGFAYSFAGVYFVIRGVCVFNQHMVIASIPEYLLDMLCIIVGAVFFVVLARYLTGNGRTGRSVCFWGTATALLGISPVIGAAAAKIFGAAELSERITFGYGNAELFFQTHAGDNAYMMTGLYIVNALVGAFAAVIVAVALTGIKPGNTDVEADDINAEADDAINEEKGDSAL